MVVFNDEIHTARNVTKTHTSNINTFQSPNQGPLGVLTKNRVQFYHHPYRQTTYQYIDVNLRVPLVKHTWVWKMMYYHFIHNNTLMV